MVYLSVFIGCICSQVYVVARIKLKTSKIIISCEVNAGEQVYTMFWLTLWRTLPLIPHPSHVWCYFIPLGPSQQIPVILTVKGRVRPTFVLYWMQEGTQ